MKQLVSCSLTVPGCCPQSEDHIYPGELEAASTLRFDKLMNMNNDAFNLQKTVGFEVVSADEEWVEFKIKCRPAEDSAR